MYEFKADMRNKPLDSIYVIEKGGYCELVIEECENKEVYKLTYEQMEKIDDDYRKEIGEPTYSEMEEKIAKLECALDDRDELIMQYEEHQDALRDKYFTSEWI